MRRAEPPERPVLAAVAALLALGGLAGCGDDASAPSTTSLAPTVATTPEGRAAAEAMLAPLPGYEYRPDAFAADLLRALAPLDGITGVASADVVRAGTDVPVATVAAFTTAGDAAAIGPAAVEAIGLAEGATTESVQVGGRPVTRYVRADGASGYLGTAPGRILVVYGSDADEVQAVLAALVGAAALPAG